MIAGNTTQRRRWLKVLIGTIMMLPLGALNAWSIYRDSFSAAYAGWTASDLSLNFTVSMICYCLGGFLGGKLSKRTSHCVTACVGGLMILVGYLVTSFLPQDPDVAKLLLLVFYGVVAGFGLGLGYNAIVSGISGWFPDRNGLATGILLTGFGLGTMLVGQLAAVLIPVLGLDQVFRSFGVVFCAVLVVGSPAVRPPDEGERATLPPAPETANVEGQQDLTTGEMVRRPTFWLFFLWNVLMCAAGLMLVNSAANIATYYGTIATLGLLLSVFNGLSRIPFGACIDVIGRRKTMILANLFLLLSGILMVAGAVAMAPVPVIAGMLIMGVSYGNSVTIGALVVRQFYGSTYYATNLAVINCCAIPASILGPMLASRLQEMSGGDYTTTFIAVMVFAVVDLLLGLLVKRP